MSGEKEILWIKFFGLDTRRQVQCNVVYSKELFIVWKHCEP